MFQQVNSIVFKLEVYKKYVNTNGLAVNGDVYKYPSAAPKNANCIGYSFQVNITQLTSNLTLNAFAAYLSISLPYARNS